MVRGEGQEKEARHLDAALHLCAVLLQRDELQISIRVEIILKPNVTVADVYYMPVLLYASKTIIRIYLQQALPLAGRLLEEDELEARARGRVRPDD